MGRYADAAARARELTNKQLAADISSFSRFTASELDGLLPRKDDKKAFLELMAEVEKETSLENKLDFLRDNLQSAGRAALMALKLFI